MIRRRVPLKRAAMTVKLSRRKGTEAKRRAAKRRALEAEKRRVYRIVDERDGNCCRVCKWSWSILHHHHIIYRSRGGQHTSENVISVCANCHMDIHDGRVKVSGTASALSVEFVGVRQTGEVA